MKRIFSLKRNKEFRYVYRNGKSIPDRYLVLIYKKQGKGLPQIGFSVSKKLGGSVARNKIKRRMRAALSPILPDIKPGSKIIFIARNPIVDAGFLSISSAFSRLLSRAELISNSDGNNAEGK